MSIVEDSYYDHSQYGLVKVVMVNEGVVMMEKQEEHTIIDGTSIPEGAKQEADEFREEAEPADMSVSADAAVFDITGVKE